MRIGFLLVFLGHENLGFVTLKNLLCEVVGPCLQGVWVGGLGVMGQSS